MNPHDEQRLRDLLDDAISDVEPRHGLDAITSRTKVTSMSNRPWLYGVGGAVLATAATIAAFAVLDGDSGTTTSPDPVDSPTAVSTEKPAKSPTPDDSPPTSPRPAETTVPVYYVGETGQGSAALPRVPQARGADKDCLCGRGGPGRARRAPGRPGLRDAVAFWQRGAARRAWRRHHHRGPDGCRRVARLARRDDRARGAAGTRAAHLHGPGRLPGPGAGAVRPRRPDHRHGAGRAHPSEPLAEGDAAHAGPGGIIDPTDGASVDSGFEVSGVGAFFEANVTWELRQGAKVVKSGFTTAEECCRMAPYSFPPL